MRPFLSPPGPCPTPAPRTPAAHDGVGLTLGIDFGTSNSAAALVGPSGQMHTMMLDGSRAEMPTALFFASETTPCCTAWTPCKPT